MQFASAITQERDVEAAIRILCEEVGRQLPQNPNLALLFVSPDYKADWEALARRFRGALGNPLLIGCSSSGVIGNDLELESLPAMSLVAASLPNVTIRPFTVSPIELELAAGGLGKRWTSSIGVTAEENPSFILIPEPFSCDAVKLLEDLNQDFSQRPVIGGVASGATAPGEHFLFFNDEVVREGAVGVALTGDIALETIVSQGCRPIGERYVVTKAEENALLELGGRPPVELLQVLFAGLSARDRILAQRALFIGVAMSEMKSVFKRGDFLIRNIMGLEPETSALIVGDRIQTGQTIQFHLRDARTSTKDLQALLEEHSPSLKSNPPAGMLLFSCQGRGKGFYGTPNHDIQLIRSLAGASAIAGFFCNGEIGPVGGRAYLHGYTSSLGIFRRGG